MTREKFIENLSSNGQLVRVELGAAIVPHIVSVRNGHELRLFVDSLWGFVRHKNSDGASATEAFTFKYRSTPAFHGACEKVSFSFAFGKYIGIAIQLDGRLLQGEQIEQVAFFSNTDGGTMLVSFCPFLDEDARPLVMEFSSKKRWRVAAQHLAAAWLHAIWGLKSQN